MEPQQAQIDPSAAFHFKSPSPPPTKGVKETASRLTFDALLQLPNTEASDTGLAAPHVVARVQSIIESDHYSALVTLLPVNEDKTVTLRLCLADAKLTASSVVRLWLPLWPLILPDDRKEYLCTNHQVIS